jgi:CheY-like chemotaxis protein
MLTNEEFLEHLHSALHHLYEPDRLRSSPLAALLGIANRLDTFSALQRILTDAIESLEPDADEPPQSRAWEIYEPLYYRYVQQLTQRQVAKQLGMSIRHLRRKEHAALEVLASHLWSEFNLEERLNQDADRGASPAQAETTPPTVGEELAWLKDTAPESPVDLNRLLPEVVRLAEPLAIQHGNDLAASIAATLPALAVHEIALSQALLTLLNLVIRHASGEVSISARPLPMEVEIRIQAATSPANVGSIRDASADSLDLAQRLVGICGGRMTFSGQGGAFDAVVTLPVLGRVPVLVVDDNADTLQLLRRYVAGTRYRLVTTRDPEHALELTGKHSPEVIVLDVMMPRVDGWKVLAQLEQHVLTKDIPVVVCTILPQEEMAFSLGASDFVRKPIERQVFLDALDRQIV